ncbi:MAG TPA: hypothetical protein VHC39_03080 [Rhizomicrobium sp.]|nr:hypothetical protein [Rhizomicrobium sp.]
MHKAARILGIVWISMATIAGLILLIADSMIKVAPSYYGHGLIFAMFGAILPGVLLYRWGHGPYVRQPTVKEMLRPKAPVERAVEDGHVLMLNADDVQW